VVVSEPDWPVPLPVVVADAAPVCTGAALSSTWTASDMVALALPDWVAVTVIGPGALGRYLWKK
jgi:hypothetical protein